MDLKLFGKTVLVANKLFGLFWPIRSGSSVWLGKPPPAHLQRTNSKLERKDADAFFDEYLKGEMQDADDVDEDEDEDAR